ncbi:Iron-sulfur cluster assembly scaffold protein IscU 2 [Candidatus Bilamarchaeum dharawalense]|uniref:Iron-sulfur cluster assembly scaffold protein IscU 2 n=1 Tax=Candidatus Bilamarchaeum dharawalense TaxID=2885759 RepID=A0A5E4LQB1_9ARCH|nr:Iron-sulfur cluster assembly scaffold protein IscU 2 [Candidatus Bilamarchaeum dharawalense]
MDDIYQEFIIELYKNPMNFGRMAKPDYHAEVHNSTCGDRIELSLKMKSGIIVDVKFAGSGCAISQASSSLFTEYLKGKTLDQLKKIDKQEVLALLKIDLSKNPSRMKCALLPLDALKKSIK